MGSTSPQFLADGRTVVYAANGGSGFGSDSYSFRARDFISGQLTDLSNNPFVGIVSSFSISRDGKTAAFATQTITSSISYDLYTQNLATGNSTKLTSQTAGNRVAIDPTFSPDGKRLVFSTGQSDLVAHDTNGVGDVYVKDLTSGALTLVSTAADGSQASGGQRAFFTADSSKVVFTSAAANLVTGDTNGLADVFIKDLSTGAITVVPNTTGYQARAISADGSKILLVDRPTGNVGTGASSLGNLYSLDTKTGTLITISNPDSSLGFGSNFDPSYSPDGTKVLFNERTTGSSGVTTDRVVLTDLITGTREVLADGYARQAVFSIDGARVAFTSDLALVPTDANFRADVYLRDLFNPVFGQQVTDISGNGGKVYALYAGLLGRAPDSLGIEVNTAAVNAGTSLRDLAALFLNSPEGQARSGAATDVQFVTQLYRTTLGREPDQDGLSNYVNFLGAGGARAQVAVDFSLSTEFLNALQPQLATGIVVTDAQAAQAARLYYAILDRPPDASGLSGWTNYLKEGGSLSGAANAFLSSPESKAASTADNATYVNSLYVNALDRPAETAGLQGWVAYLDAVGTRGAVAAAIAESPEAQIHLVGVIENGFFLTG